VDVLGVAIALLLAEFVRRPVGAYSRSFYAAALLSAAEALAFYTESRCVV
jgi:hypothetical protein